MRKGTWAVQATKLLIPLVGLLGHALGLLERQMERIEFNKMFVPVKKHVATEYGGRVCG